MQNGNDVKYVVDRFYRACNRPMFDLKDVERHSSAKEAFVELFINQPLAVAKVLTYYGTKTGGMPMSRCLTDLLSRDDKVLINGALYREIEKSWSENPTRAADADRIIDFWSENPQLIASSEDLGLLQSNLSVGGFRQYCPDNEKIMWNQALQLMTALDADRVALEIFCSRSDIKAIEVDFIFLGTMCTDKHLSGHVAEVEQSFFDQVAQIRSEISHVSEQGMSQSIN